MSPRVVLHCYDLNVYLKVCCVMHSTEMCCTFVVCSRSRIRWASCTRWTRVPTGAAGWSACWPSWRSGARPSPPVPPSASSRWTCTACTCMCASAGASWRYARCCRVAGHVLTREGRTLQSNDHC